MVWLLLAACLTGLYAQLHIFTADFFFFFLMALLLFSQSVQAQTGPLVGVTVQFYWLGGARNRCDDRVLRTWGAL